MDKLTVINNACAETANNQINALNDGSPEWQVADSGFVRAVKFLIARHNWPFAQTIEDMVRLPDTENKSRMYPTNAFRVPDCLHLIEVYYNQSILTGYEVMGNVLSCAYNTGISGKIIRAPADEIWHPMAEEILTLMVETSLLRGLNEDYSEADRRERKAEELLFEARPRADQVNPARNMFKSPSRMARGTRRI